MVPSFFYWVLMNGCRGNSAAIGRPHCCRFCPLFLYSFIYSFFQTRPWSVSIPFNRLCLFVSFFVCLFGLTGRFWGFALAFAVAFLVIWATELIYLIDESISKRCHRYVEFSFVYRVLPSFTGYHQVLSGFTRFYWVLLGFSWLLSGFTEF